MPEPTEQPKQEPQEQDGNTPPAVAQNTETVSYSRFKEVNDRRKASEARIEELEAAETKRQADAEAAQQKRLEEKEEFKTLYETAKAEKAQAVESLEATNGRLQRMEAALNAQWDSQKDLIPEWAVDLVEEMPIEERIAWLAEKKEKLSAKEKGNGTPRRTQGKGITPPSETAQENRGLAFKF